jgi:hypothetical protein
MSTKMQPRQDNYWHCSIVAYLDPGDIILKERGASIEAKTKRACANLFTLTKSWHGTNVMEFRLGGLDHHEIATGALQLVHTHSQAIPSLLNIIFKVCEKDLEHSRNLNEIILLVWV